METKPIWQDVQRLNDPLTIKKARRCHIGLRTDNERCETYM